MALHFRSQNGCDNSTLRGRIDSLISALFISKRLYSGAKMALYFRSRNGPYNSTFRGGIDYQCQNVATEELKWPSISGAEMAPNISTFWG